MKQHKDKTIKEQLLLAKKDIKKLHKLIKELERDIRWVRRYTKTPTIDYDGPLIHG